MPAPRRNPLRRLEGPTLPPLPCTKVATPAAGHAPSPPVAAPRPVPAPPPPRVQTPPPRPYGRVITCCWPIGEPGTRSFRFCDAESVPGKPYCSEHAQLAYVKVRDRREDAA